MFNGNSLRDLNHELITKKKRSASEIRKDNKKKELKNYLAQKSENRKQDWLQTVAQSEIFAKHFHDGAIPLIHPDLMDFRPSDVKNNAFKKNKYTSEKKRALEMSKSYKDIYFLEGEKYNAKDFNKLPVYRDVDKKKIIQPELKYTYSNTKQKVLNNIKDSERYALEPMDEKMRFNPKFRENHRDQWVSRNDFKMGYKNKTIKPIKNSSHDVFDPYLGGKEKVIAMTSRPLDKTKNISDVEFSSVISKDPFQYRKNNLSSLRSYGNINATIVKTGLTTDITSFVKQRKSMNISKSLSKLVNIKKENNQTINEILADFNQTAGKICKIKSQLKGTQNNRYNIVKELEDKDILDLITANKKIYHMSAYQVVKEPEIVLRNKGLSHSKRHIDSSVDFSRHMEPQSPQGDNNDLNLMSTFQQLHTQGFAKQDEDHQNIIELQPTIKVSRGSDGRKIRSGRRSSMENHAVVKFDDEIKQSKKGRETEYANYEHDANTGKYIRKSISQCNVDEHK